MRDINRIPIILDNLRELWEKYPDMRLGQLIGNVIEGPALYYVEDEKLIEILNKAYETLKSNN